MSLIYQVHIERFSIQSRKTKTKVINYPDQSQKNVNNTKDQSVLEANACDRCQARENACERGTIYVSFVSHWLKKWREFW